jgi:hypothetical protein
MDPGGKIYTTGEFRCWKVENLDDERSDENKNAGGGYRIVSPQKVSRFTPLNRYYIIIDEKCFPLRHFGQLSILSIPDAIKRI